VHQLTNAGKLSTGSGGSVKLVNVGSSAALKIRRKLFAVHACQEPSGSEHRGLAFDSLRHGHGHPGPSRQLLVCLT
jgi:hypothetical protein